MKKILVTLVASFACLNASAGSVTAANITSLYSMSNGVILITVSTAISGTPSCNTAGRFAVDPASTAGKPAASLVQMAFLTGKPVLIDGNGYCNLWSDSETVFDIKISN